MTDEESTCWDDYDEKIAFVTIKEDWVETSLISNIDCNKKWIIDYDCSHHITEDQRKFHEVELYDGGTVRSSNDALCAIIGKCFISLNDSIDCEDKYLMEVLKYNMLRIAQLSNNGYRFEFGKGSCRILDKIGKVLAIVEQSKGDMFYLNSTINSYFRTKS